MSWEVDSYLLLGAVLVGGFAWYERSQPSARIVALVAALAALAVAGRLVFAPIPNVQATTDVVLFTGFALGAAPGFAVGALGALISNMWLGQGPWTPWEMAGWGLVGLAGAGLGTLTARRLGRFGLAAAAAIAGLAYGALLDFSVMATAGGDLSLDRYLAIAARGVPFNLVHAVGNAVLALAAGPALVRMIVRFRERTEFTWRPELAAPLVALVVAVGAVAPAQRASADSTALGWLAAARNPDGGFGSSPGSDSSAAITGWAALGLEAGGRNPLDTGRAGRTPIDYLRAHADTLTSTGDVERTVLALEGAGVSPQAFGGQNLISKLRARRGGDGSYQDQVNLTAFGVLAMRSAGASAASVRPSVSWLEKAQGDDGGWGFQVGVGSDPDSTGAALQGLAAGGGDRSVLARGVRYLRRDQTADGGWPLGGTGPSNSQSTAWAVQGLIAAGRSPASVTTQGRSGLDYLAAQRSSDGHYRYSSSSDQTPVWVTGQALLAAEQKALPLATVARSRPTHHTRHTRHRGASGGSEKPRSGSGSRSTSPAGSPSAGSGTPAGGGSGGGSSAAWRSSDGKRAGSAGSPKRPSSAPSGGGGGEASRRLFADADVPTTPAGSLVAPADSGSGSHTARNVGAGLLAAGIVATGFLWRRRRRA